MSDPQETATKVQVKERKGISIVWLVPLVAAAVAGWLIYTTFAEKGPTVIITFETAEGLEAGKTKIKYKDIEVGHVTNLGISDDLANVLGYEKRGEFLFSYEDGAIVDIIYFTNDSEIIVAITGWVDENHPGAPPCAATAEELDAYYGEPGVLAAADGEIFGTACAERLVENAAEYRDSGLYLPPIDS